MPSLVCLGTGCTFQCFFSKKKIKKCSNVTTLPVVSLALGETQHDCAAALMLAEWLHADSSDVGGLAHILFGSRPEWAHPWPGVQLLSLSAVLLWPLHPVLDLRSCLVWGRGLVEVWGMTTGSLPASRRLLSTVDSGLHCSLRRGPVCSGRPPELSCGGARPGQLSGVVLQYVWVNVCVCGMCLEP